MPDHILSDRHLIVNLPVMHLELQPDKVREDGGGSRLCFYGRRALAWYWPDDGESISSLVFDDGGRVMSWGGV